MHFRPERHRVGRGRPWHTGPRGRLTAALLIVFLGAAGSGCLTPPAWSMPGSIGTTTLQPPGTANGSVQLEGEPLDDDPAGTAHLRCEFGIQFLGFDEGINTAAVTFRAWPPTADRSPMTTSQGELAFTFHGSGVADEVDHTEDYRLDTDRFELHGKGEVHVRMDVLVTDSGGKTLKRHTAFWLRPCDAGAHSVGARNLASAAPSPAPASTSTDAAAASTGPSTDTVPTPRPTGFAGGIDRASDEGTGSGLAWLAVVLGLGVAGLGLIRLLKSAGRSRDGA